MPVKSQKIYAAIGGVDDELLARCRAAETSGGRIHWRRWAALAACLCIIIAGVAVLNGRFQTGGSDDTPPLPLLAISPGEDGMGFEGYMAFDFTRLVNSNPWRADANIPTLPVYKNPLVFIYGDDYNVPGADFDKMRELLLTLAARLGMNIDSLNITDNRPDEAEKNRIIEMFKETGRTAPESLLKPTCLIARQKGTTITVSNQMEATIEFEPGVPLPEGYKNPATYDDAAALAQYFKDQYAGLVGMENPQTDISGGDYNIYEKQLYNISLFEGGESIQDQITGYNFRRADFHTDENGDLSFIRIYCHDLSEKIGDYPIITLKEAEARLEEGYYITSVPDETMGEVVGAQLVYRTGGSNEYYIPFYRFLIELPEIQRKNGLKTCGAYYVPAIEPRYISDITVWSGTFN